MRSWQALVEWIDARTLRERLLLFAGSLFLLIYPFFAFFDQMTRQQQQLQEKLREFQLRQELVSAQLAKVASDLAKDWRAPLLRQKQELSNRRQEIAKRLEQARTTLVPAKAMSAALRSLLDGFPHLQLVSLKSLPVTPLQSPNAEGAKERAALYRRGIEVVLEGEYLMLVQYLQSVENGQWRFLWGPARFEVVDYPRTRLTH